MTSFLLGKPGRKLIVMATGTGKTHVIADACAQAAARFGLGRTLILVHRRELVDQAAARLATVAPHLTIGTEMASRTAQAYADVVIASVQTVGTKSAKRLAWFEPDLIIVDEAHHAAADSYQRAIQRLSHGQERHVLGFTATPHRMGKRVLVGESGSFSGVLFEYGVRQGMEEGYLCDLRGFSVKTDVNLTSVRIVHGDFSERELAQVIDTDARTAVAVKAWKEKAPDRQTIAFCASIAHAEHVAEFFRTQGVSAKCVSSNTPADERETTLRAFARGDIQVVTNVAVLGEGVDLPATGCLLMLRPTRSWTAFLQMIGRGFRISPGKRDCIVLDVVDVTGRHKVCTLPGVAGLPARTNMAGATLAEAFNASDEQNVALLPSEFEGTLEEMPAKIRERLLLEAHRGQETRGRLLEAFGESKSLSAWAEDPRCMPNKGTLKARLRDGWTPERALTKPKRGVESLVGKRFGRLVVASQPGRRVHCRCDCGETVVTEPASLKKGMTSSCGCLRRDSIVYKAGVKFHYLTTTGESRKSPVGKTQVRCLCDCGNEIWTTPSRVRDGETKSCGCRLTERFAKHVWEGAEMTATKIAQKVGVQGRTLRRRLAKGMTIEEAVADALKRKQSQTVKKGLPGAGEK